jgi:hypothetical protein
MAVQHLTDAELTRLAEELRAAVPPLNEDEQRIAVAVYRLLAEGEPVVETRIPAASGIAADKVARTLARWPGVYRDDHGDIVGFWRLTQQEFPHTASTSTDASCGAGAPGTPSSSRSSSAEPLASNRSAPRQASG